MTDLQMKAAAYKCRKPRRSIQQVWLIWVTAFLLFLAFFAAIKLWGWEF